MVCKYIYRYIASKIIIILSQKENKEMKPSNVLPCSKLQDEDIWEIINIKMISNTWLIRVTMSNNIPIDISPDVMSQIEMKVFYDRDFSLIEPFLQDIPANKKFRKYFFQSDLLLAAGILNYMKKYSINIYYFPLFNRDVLKHNHLLSKKRRNEISQYIMSSNVCTWEQMIEIESNADTMSDGTVQKLLKDVTSSYPYYMHFLFLRNGRLSDAQILDLVEQKDMPVIKYICRNYPGLISNNPSLFINHLRYIEDEKAFMKVATLVKTPIPRDITLNNKINYNIIANMKSHHVDYEITSIDDVLMNLYWLAKNRSKVKITFSTDNYRKIYAVLDKVGPKKGTIIIHFLVRNKCFPTIDSIKIALNNTKKFLIKYGKYETEKFFKTLILKSLNSWKISHYLFHQYEDLFYPPFLEILKEIIQGRETQFIQSFHSTYEREVRNILGI